MQAYFSGLCFRYKKIVEDNFEAMQRKKLPRPANPSLPALPLQAFSGSYTNAGYEDLELCWIGPPSTRASNASKSCKKAVRELPRVIPGAVNTSVPTLVAKWDKFWSTHLKLEHFDGMLWNVSVLESRVCASRSA